MTKAWEIIAYQYEADEHCVQCAEERFGQEPDKSWVREDAVDNEGNEVHPIFASDVTFSGPAVNCSDCGSWIYGGEEGE